MIVCGVGADDTGGAVNAIGGIGVVFAAAFKWAVLKAIALGLGYLWAIQENTRDRSLLNH